MSITPHEANIFDSSAATRLRRQLGEGSEDGIREVAKQFESLFVQMMLKSMRAATPGDDLFSGTGTDQYRDLYDQQMALAVSDGDGPGFGIADMVERQLREHAGLEAAAPAGGGKGIQEYRRMPVRELASPPAAESAPKPGAPVTAASGLGGKGDGWDTPEEFVRDIWPAARRAADELGADPRALVAQAALETGWGRHVIRRSDGEGANNLFGIKASAGWEGERVRVPTLEYRDGIPRREMAEFRAYDTLEESFRDYLAFLRNNPRYADALEVSDDPVAFTDALQQAGYATDPQYARKIQQIMSGDILEAALPGLKNGGQRTTSL